MPRAPDEDVVAVRARVAEAHLGGLDRAVAGEVAAGDEVDDVLARDVGAGHPAGALGDARVEQVADAGGALEPERAGPDVALDERRGARRSRPRVKASTSAGSTWAPSRFSSTSRSPGTPMASGSRVPSGCTSMTTTFLSVSPAVHGRSSRGKRSLRCATRVSIVGVSGVSSACAAGTPSHPTGLGGRHPHGLDVGGIPAARAVDVGVLADLGGGEELLALAAAHRAGHRLDDDVVEAEPVEDADVGLAVQLVALVEPGRVDVEGVGVLHDELTAAQHAGARARLVAVLRLDLVDRERQVLVGASRGP